MCLICDLRRSLTATPHSSPLCSCTVPLCEAHRARHRTRSDPCSSIQPLSFPLDSSLQACILSKPHHPNVHYNRPTPSTPYTSNTMPINLKGKTVLITGGSRGLGAEIARKFAAQGCNVCINYANSKDDAEKLVHSLEKDFRIKGITMQAVSLFVQ